MSANASRQRQTVSTAIDKLLASTLVHLLFNNKPDAQWRHFLELYEMARELIDAQDALFSLRKKCGGMQDNASSSVPLQQRLNAFRSWIYKNGVDEATTAVDWKGGFMEGIGMVAKHDIKKGDTLITIPRNLFLTSDDALKLRKIRNMLESETNAGAEARQLPFSALLALFLLHEKHSISSFWKPYIDVLPETHPIPFMFTPMELRELKGTSVLLDFVRFFRDMLRFYVILYDGVETHRILPLHKFTLVEWRWALCTIYTRQNRIPSFTLADLQKLEEKYANDIIMMQRMQEQMQQRFIFALVPGWDMFNHRDGYKITSEVNIADGNHHCVSPDDVQMGHQVYIGYTEHRANRERFLYSGYLAQRAIKDDFVRVAITTIPAISNANNQKRRESILKSNPYLLDINLPLNNNHDNILGIVGTMLATEKDLVFYESLENVTVEKYSTQATEALARNRKAAAFKFNDEIEPLECRETIIGYVRLQINLVLRNLSGTNEEDELAAEAVGEDPTSLNLLRKNIFCYRIFERNLCKSFLQDLNSIIHESAQNGKNNVTSQLMLS